MARPPVATERLSRMEDGRLLYRLKHRWRDGTTHVVFEPLELLERLAALVPPPRFHLVRYHGILAPCASARDRVVPVDPEPFAQTSASVSPSGRLDAATADGPAGGADGSPRRPAPSPADAEGRELAREGSSRLEERIHIQRRRRSLSWAELMRRVFAIDVLECPRCGGAMRILAAIHPPETTRAILECLELPSRAPPTEPARHDEAEEVGLPGGLGWDDFSA